jgi:broad specificity phosphatase PhoE
VPPPRIVYLARHGETDWNAAGRWQGQSDIPLNARGREQARALGEDLLRLAALRHERVAALVSSDLSRARETATIAGEALGLTLAYVDPALRERMFGVFEGLTREDCERLHPEAWQAWVAKNKPPPGGEAREVLAARVTAGIERASELVPREGTAVLVVSHGGGMRSAVGVATGTTPGPVVNGALWRIEWDGGIKSVTSVP